MTDNNLNPIYPHPVLASLLASTVLRAELPRLRINNYQDHKSFLKYLLGITILPNQNDISMYAHTTHVCTNCNNTWALSTPHYNVYHAYCPSCCSDYNSVVDRTSELYCRDYYRLIYYCPVPLQDSIHKIVIDRITNSRHTCSTPTARSLSQ